MTAFGVIGWQVQRRIDGQAWSNTLMWMSVLAGIVTGVCVLAWTWTATENARRLVGPAATRELPDPKVALRTWIVPFAFVGVAVAVVAVLGERVDAARNDSVSALPLAVAVIALLLAIPMTYRPLHYLAGVVRQVGGYSAHLAQWMWVPVALAVVGIGSIVTLRFAGVDDDSATTATGWAPLWVVAVVAIAPCVIVVLLAWRAASSVEEALTIAATRRVAAPVGFAPAGVRSARISPARRRSLTASADVTRRIELIRGAEMLRLVTVTLIAGLALLSVVGAVVTGLLWKDSTGSGVLPAQRQRTWDALDVLRTASGAVTLALVISVSLWTFVTVLNVRAASGRRRNPLIPALAWPAAGFGVWWIADRMIVDESIGRVVLGFAAQAAVMAVPFLLLERSADAIGARRTPLRIVYVLVVVLLVHVQGLGGLSNIPDTATSTEIGRLAGYLAIGALIQLCSTLAVTEGCRAMSRACEHEADHHNMLVDQRITTHRPDRVASR